jgi:hypothetical protein
MWKDLLLRFFIGGMAVSLFAFIGDLLRPKSLAGLFTAAPSIALGSLGLAVAKHDGVFTSLEGRSMMGGAIALLVYSQLLSWMLMRHRYSSFLVEPVAILLWFGTAFGVWFVALV